MTKTAETFLPSNVGPPVTPMADPNDVVQQLLRAQGPTPASPAEGTESIYPEAAWAEADLLGIPRSLTKADRDKIDAGDFCGPHRSFPIDTEEHLHSAAKLIGHADDPGAVKACAIRKAKAKGWALPKSWQDGDGDDGKQRGVPPGTQQPGSGPDAEKINAHAKYSGTHQHYHAHGDGSTHTHHHEHAGDVIHDGHDHHKPHAVMSGSHSHVHMHPDGASHEHDHYHEGHSHHDHTHFSRADGTITDQPQAPQAPAPDISLGEAARRMKGGGIQEQLFMYAPIVRFDETKREVIGQATAEVPDAYGTIFAYYPEAWQKWRGNMREQHDSKRAVGKALEILPDPDNRAINVVSKVSRSQDGTNTWIKLTEGILSGYSANVKPDPEFGMNPATWPKKEYQGKYYPYLPRYSVIELSYVDAPATPGCEVALVRSDGMLVGDVLDNDWQPPKEPTNAEVLTEAQTKFHRSIEHAKEGLLAQYKDCGCLKCQFAARALEGSIETNQVAEMQAIIQEALRPVYARFQALATSFARAQGTERKDGVLERLNTMEEVLAGIQKTLKRIDETPVPGAPINFQAQAATQNKQLATDPRAPTRPSYGAVYEAIARMSDNGQLNSVQDQVDAMAAGLVAQRRGY